MQVRHVAMGFAAILIGIMAPAWAQSPPQALSFTAAQAASGENEYKTSCMDCHGPHLDDGEFGGPPLKGSAFTAKWFKLPASGLLGYIRTAMPPDAPGRLPLGTYVEIAAYILSMNGLPPGPKDMPADMNALAGMHYPQTKTP